MKPQKRARRSSPYTRIRVELCASRDKGPNNRVRIYLSRSFQVLGQDMQYEGVLKKIIDSFGPPFDKLQWKKLRTDAEEARKRIQIDTPGIDLDALMTKASTVRPHTSRTQIGIYSKVFTRIKFSDWSYYPPGVRKKVSNFLLAKGTKKAQSYNNTLLRAGIRIGSYQRGKPETLLKEGTKLWQQVRQARLAAQSLAKSAKPKSEKKSSPFEKSMV